MTIALPAPVQAETPTKTIKALDLFAGTGWGVACQRLGIHEDGVEIMPEAIATRAANGMSTIYNDVWEGLQDAEHTHGYYNLLIASPPCQTFSMAGSGSGRAALDDVLAAIAAGAYKDVADLHALGEATDPRTALVLTPLAHVWRDYPEYVVFEQVPPVLPVWEACAEVMRERGYSVWTGVLNAEQYGVPQTRRRAILIAKLFGEAKPPTPTHSRYYPKAQTRRDPGVLPWVSMAAALGLVGERGATLVANDRLANSARRHESAPAPTITGGHDRDNRVWQADRPTWPFEKPSSTVVGSFSPEIIAGPGGSGTRPTDLSKHRQDRPDSVKVAASEAAVLQSYPADFIWDAPVPNGRGGSKPMPKTKKFLMIGNAVPPLLAEAILRAVLTELRA